MGTDNDRRIPEFVGRESLALSTEQIDTLLEQIGYGVLALSMENDSYALPVSFGYDRESTLYFQFGRKGESEKMAFIDATDRATFVAYDINPPRWQSVIAMGDVDSVPEEDATKAYETHKDNAWVPFNVFEKPLDDVEFDFYRLTIENVLGYGTPAMD